MFPHPPSGALFTVHTSAQYLVGGNSVTQTQTHELYLPKSGPRATMTYRSGPSADAPMASQALEMDVDTIVYDRDMAQFYVVWRGVWDYASLPSDRYVSLVLS